MKQLNEFEAWTKSVAGEFLTEAPAPVVDRSLNTSGIVGKAMRKYADLPKDEAVLRYIDDNLGGLEKTVANQNKVINALKRDNQQLTKASQPIDTDDKEIEKDIVQPAEKQEIGNDLEDWKKSVVVELLKKIEEKKPQEISQAKQAVDAAENILVNNDQQELVDQIEKLKQGNINKDDFEKLVQELNTVKTQVASKSEQVALDSAVQAANKIRSELDSVIEWGTKVDDYVQQLKSEQGVAKDQIENFGKLITQAENNFKKLDAKIPKNLVSSFEKFKHRVDKLETQATSKLYTATFAQKIIDRLMKNLEQGNLQYVERDIMTLKDKMSYNSWQKLRNSINKFIETQKNNISYDKTGNLNVDPGNKAVLDGLYKVKDLVYDVQPKFDSNKVGVKKQQSDGSTSVPRSTLPNEFKTIYNVRELQKGLGIVDDRIDKIESEIEELLKTSVSDVEHSNVVDYEKFKFDRFEKFKKAQQDIKSWAQSFLQDMRWSNTIVRILPSDLKNILEQPYPDLENLDISDFPELSNYFNRLFTRLSQVAPKSYIPISGEIVNMIERDLRKELKRLYVLNANPARNPSAERFTSDIPLDEFVHVLSDKLDDILNQLKNQAGEITYKMAESTHIKRVKLKEELQVDPIKFEWARRAAGNYYVELYDFMSKYFPDVLMPLQYKIEKGQLGKYLMDQLFSELYFLDDQPNDEQSMEKFLRATAKKIESETKSNSIRARVHPYDRMDDDDEQNQQSATPTPTVPSKNKSKVQATSGERYKGGRISQRDLGKLDERTLKSIDSTLDSILGEQYNKYLK